MTDKTPPGRDHDIKENRLQILLLDYEMGRDDERSVWGLTATIFSAFIALLTLLGAVATNTKNIPDVLLAGSPLLPFAVFAYMLMIGAIGTLRGYYLRGLESELRKYGTEAMTELGDLQPASYMGVMIEMQSLRGGRPVYRLLVTFILLATLIVFGGLTVYIGLAVKSILLQICMLVMYIICFLVLLIETLVASAGGRGLFLRTARSFLKGQKEEFLPRVTQNDPDSLGERSLVSYLLFPRPKDWIKWVIAPGTFLISALSTTSWNNWVKFILVWLVLEYLIYAARYQFNDMRGVVEDERHPERKSRARMPSGSGDSKMLRRNVRWSTVVASLRLSVAITIGFISNVGNLVLSLIFLIFTVAIPYEIIRKKLRENTGGIDTGVSSNLVRSVWIIVGFGYAIRAGVGFAFGGFPLLSVTAISGMVFFATFGMMFVLFSWVLEATSFCYVQCDRRILRKPALAYKSHIWKLLEYVGMEPSGSQEGDVANCGILRVLEGRGELKQLGKLARSRDALKWHDEFRSPWNWAMIISVALGSVTGAGLARIDLMLCAAIIPLSLAGGVLLALSTSTYWRLIMVTVVAAGIIVVTQAVSTVSDGDLLILVAAPWTIVSLTYVSFRAVSYQMLNAPINLKPFFEAADKHLLAILTGNRIV